MQDTTNTAAIRAWEQFSREAIEAHGDEGDFARQHLLNPVIFRLLGDVQGKTLLDAGCGQGYLCRMLARRGARVTGIEPASNFYAYALEREQAEPLGITYLQADLSTFEDPEAAFDLVVSNMVFMDIPDYANAMRFCIRALKAGGSFVFSINHPCFEETAKQWTEQGYVAVREYFHEQALSETWFHRPLSAYLNLVAREGCRLEELVEPQLSEELVVRYGQQHARNMYVPQFLIVHAVKA